MVYEVIHLLYIVSSEIIVCESTAYLVKGMKHSLWIVSNESIELGGISNMWLLCEQLTCKGTGCSLRAV